MKRWSAFFSEMNDANLISLIQVLAEHVGFPIPEERLKDVYMIPAGNKRER